MSLCKHSLMSFSTVSTAMTSELIAVCVKSIAALCLVAGNGANMAFMDGWELAHQLASPSNQTLADAVSAYDAESAPRSAAAVKEGSRNIWLWHQKGIGHYAIISLIAVAGFLFKFPYKAIQSGFRAQEAVAQRFARLRSIGKPAGALKRDL